MPFFGLRINWDYLGVYQRFTTSILGINTSYTCCKNEMVGCKVSKSGERKKNKERQIENENLLSSDEAHELRRPQHEKVLKRKNFKHLGLIPKLMAC